MVGAMGVVALLVMIGLAVPIGIALLVSGFAGLIALMGLDSALSFIGVSMYNVTAVYGFVAVPLFLLMGSFAFYGGFADGAYTALYKWVYKLPGALAVATTLACGAFGAASGSSQATAAIFSKISLPQMIRYNYSRPLAAGCIAASGTFATMIPPSSLLIVYGIFTEQSIGRLFIAGILPGLCTVAVYALSVVIRVWRHPQLAPMVAGEAIAWRERIFSLRLVWPIAVLVAVVIGGIYSGMFTATEAGAAGVIAALVMAIILRGIRGTNVLGILRETAHITAMIFLIIVGAIFFSRFIAVSQIPTMFVEFLLASAMSPLAIMASLILMYFFLGMIINPTGMMAITLPVVFPIVISLGYDPIWFGIIVIKTCEIGLVTPPVAQNAYIMKGALGDAVSLGEIFQGIWPFVLCDAVVLGFLIAFPCIATFLPTLMMG